MRLKCPAWVEPERGEIEVYPTCLLVKRVQIAEDDYNVGKVVCRLAITDHFRIVRLMKKQIGVTLQGSILAANAVDACDEILQAPRTLQIPMLQLVLLGVEVLFAAGLPGGVVAKLERRAVYAVVRPHRGGKNQAHHESGAASGLQEFRENVGGIRP